MSDLCHRGGACHSQEVGVCGRSLSVPEEELQLRVQVADERAACDDLSVAVVQRQAAVTHVLAVYALGPCGDADYLGLLHVRAWTRVGGGNQDQGRALGLLCFCIFIVPIPILYRSPTS